ncbi:MAG: Maf family protein [Pyrinomonadaceae bacterium]
MRLEEILNGKLRLASKSPRRAEILRAVGCRFEVRAVDIDETRNDAEEAVAYVERLARGKAGAVTSEDDGVVLGADTVVVVEGEILGKPRDEEDARRMLGMLNDRWHEVLTGVALVAHGDRARTVVAHERTRVRFARMSDEEINWYVNTGEPMDKAGAYAIQGSAALFIKAVEGDYWNVVGLPIQLVYKLAREL